VSTNLGQQISKFPAENFFGKVQKIFTNIYSAPNIHSAYSCGQDCKYKLGGVSVLIHDHQVTKFMTKGYD